ncbi:putative disease resistance protein RGA3 [Humulus lupulus]|uniref:putative disease resistance protein RGA3 n=1 Tax=Humulus lupulus TaxID=3486 RepID=UPI002B40F543|nr:putative disease resistance protein RGA3 [Humulus lupulus]
MAAGNLSLVAKRILNLLDPERNIRETASRWGGHHNLLRGLANIVSELAPVLLDAEKKSQRDRCIRKWVMDLEDVLYDADNLLNEISTEAMRRKLMTEKSGIVTQVRSDFFPPASVVKMTKKMRSYYQKIKEVERILDEIGARRKDFDLENLSEAEVDMETNEDSLNQIRSFIDEGVLISSHDKIEIVVSLLDSKHKGNLVILPVFGKAGLGKTTFAEDVFNDEMVEDHFDFQILLSASQKFDDQHILRLILVHRTGRTDDDLWRDPQSQKELLRNSLLSDDRRSPMRILIVLDDLQSEDLKKWDSLTEVFEFCAKGSKILVTTRSPRVAQLLLVRPYPSSDLNQEQLCILFEKIVFDQEEESWTRDRSLWIRIRNKMVKRCGGHPPDIMTIGSKLRSRTGEQWQLSKLGEDYLYNPFPFTSYAKEIAEVPRLLKLCYDDLPSPLKHCFAYCSLFPKGEEIDVQTLIRLWMAQGFIVIAKESDKKSLEDVGYQYVLNLIDRYFLQEVERDANQVTKCKVDYLMYDLAISVTGDQCRILDSAATLQKNSKTFHVRFNFDLNSTEDVATFDREKMRTIVLSGQSRRVYKGIAVDTIFDKITSKFRFLLALDMHASGLDIVPNTISKLKLLKYLDISENEDLTILPNSISELINLQTLILSKCYKLEKLPTDFGNLVNLRHLEIDGCNNLAYLPLGIKQLKLKELSQLVVSVDSSQTLVRSSELIRQFGIRNLRLKNMRHKETVVNYLKEVPSRIQSLSLEWKVGKQNSVHEQPPLSLDKNLPSDLKELSINGFGGVTVCCPDFHLCDKLVKLSLSRCTNCKNLQAVNQISGLKVLVLEDLTNLEYMLVGDSSSSSANLFSSLEKLWLSKLPKLLGWWINEISHVWPSFDRLSKLVIEDCPNLSSIPLCPNLAEGLVLDRTKWKLFESRKNLSRAAAHEGTSLPASSLPYRPHSFTYLESMSISGIEDLDADKIQWRTMKKLRFLRFNCIPGMKELPSQLHDASSLVELQVWRCPIKAIPGSIINFKKLEKLVIGICPLLQELPAQFSRVQIRTLEIKGCNTLLRRLEVGKGADWNKIKLIPEIKLGPISGR